MMAAVSFTKVKFIMASVTLSLKVSLKHHYSEKNSEKCLYNFILGTVT